jgi:hypothetical protein
MAFLPGKMCFLKHFFVVRIEGSIIGVGRLVPVL